MEIRFTVPGRPVPCVRMTQRSKYKSKKAQRYLAYKDVVGWVARTKIKTPMEGPVGLAVDVFWDGKGQCGDWDNLGKSISDALNHIAYEDDRRIKDGHVHIEVGEPERVEVRVWQL